MALDHEKDTWLLYSLRTETRRHSVALFDLSGNMYFEWLKFFAALRLSKNNIKSTVLIWGVRINFSVQANRQIQSLQIMRTDSA